MSRVPHPPGFKPPEAPVQPIKVAEPQPRSHSPTVRTYHKPSDDKSVNRDETSFLLKRHLIPQHQTDPNVIGFIKNYLLCRSASQAAKETGLRARDGENLLRRPDIHEAIKKITEVAVLKHGYDAGEVVERVKEIMRVDPADVQRPDGSFINKMSELPYETRRAIKKMRVKNLFEKDPNGMEVIVGEVIEIEFWDKMKAVELLGREKEIFKETKKIEHDVTANMSSILLQSKKLAEDHIASLRDVGEQAQLTHSSVGEVLDAVEVADED